MKRLNILVLVLLLASGLSSAQTSLRLSDLSIPSKIAPAYFGPNAFPVPQMSDGTTSARWKAELYSDHFFGTMSDWRDDYTTSIFARLTIPLFSPRVNLVIGGPVYEFFHSGPSANAFRRLPYAGDINYHTPGDIYVSTDFQTLVQSRHGIDMTVRAALKSASGDRYVYARYYDSPGYFFDASFGREFLFSDSMALRVALRGGFLCWQTDNGRQNDAVMYGALASFEAGPVVLTSQFGGYGGWEQDGDAPMTVRVDAEWRIGDFSVGLGWQMGLAAWPFHQFRAGIGYSFL